MSTAALRQPALNLKVNPPSLQLVTRQPRPKEPKPRHSFRSWGQLNARRDNAVLVLGEAWDALFGPERLLAAPDAFIVSPLLACPDSKTLRALRQQLRVNRWQSVLGVGDGAETALASLAEQSDYCRALVLLTPSQPPKTLLAALERLGIPAERSFHDFALEGGQLVLIDHSETLPGLVQLARRSGLPCHWLPAPHGAGDDATGQRARLGQELQSLLVI